MSKTAAGLIGLLPLVLAGCGPREPRPAVAGNVLLITLDTCRADRLGCYGNERVDTPHLDALARDGTRFRQAFSPIPSTLPAHSSILTGTYPAHHGVHDNGVYLLEQDAVTLAERLDAAGMSTAAFVSAFVLDRQFQLDQGFQVYDDQVTAPLTRADPKDLPDAMEEGQKRWFAQLASAYQRPAEEVTRAAEGWLEQQGERPFFLWVHYFDTHQPYQAPGDQATRYDPAYTGPMDGDAGRFHQVLRARAARGLGMDPADWNHMVARYDAELAYTDQWIGHLLQRLDALGHAEDTLVVVVGDHGESFGEHRTQIWEHNSDVFDESLRVPFLVRQPDGTGRGVEVDGLVRNLDVMPTVLDWLGLPPEEGIQGTSLLPLTRDPAAPAPGQILMEARRERQIHPPSRSYLGLRTERFKVILVMDGDERQETLLFDLEQDPGEQTSLAGAESERAARLAEQAREAHQRLFRPVEALRELTELDSEALRALGYVR